MYDNYKDSLPIEEYRKNVQAVCNEIYRISTIGGRICINVPLVTKCFDTGRRISLDQLYQNCLDKAGFLFREKIVWNKKGVTKRNAWGSYMLPSCPWVVYPDEVILVYYKKNIKREVNRDLVTLEKEEFKKATYGIWWIENIGEHNKKHPAVMAKEVVERLINFYSYKNDVVLDPYLGIGTTCIVAKELERKYIGFEISKKYYDIALNSLNMIND